MKRKERLFLGVTSVVLLAGVIFLAALGRVLIQVWELREKGIPFDIGIP